MKTQLIMLDTPIIVSGEQIKEGDNYYSEGEIYLDCEDSEAPLANLPEQNCNKIIAGIAGLPTIDWNGLEEEFGWVDVEKLALEEYPDGIDGTNKSATIYRRIYIDGFKKAQSLNEKKFSLEDIRDAFKAGNRRGYSQRSIMGGYEGTNELDEDTYLQSLQQPKVFDVEIQMLSDSPYDPRSKTGWFEEGDIDNPMITNNSIKILKKL